MANYRGKNLDRCYGEAGGTEHVLSPQLKELNSRGGPQAVSKRDSKGKRMESTRDREPSGKGGTGHLDVCRKQYT